MLFCAVILLFLAAGVVPLPGQHGFLPEHERVVERQRWFLGQRAYPADTIPNTYILNTLAAERNRLDKMQQNNALQLYSWELLGPNTSGGRMTSIAVHPTNPNVWIAGSGGGGVWRTVNRGATWQQLSTRDFPVYAVGAVAYHPRFSNEIYAGTGEPNFASFTFAGAGIMRSVDGGLSWAPLGTASLKGAIADIVVHPDKPDVLFAACAGFGDVPGVYRSDNRGQTWQRTLEGTSAMDIAIHPTQRHIMYAVLSYPLGNLYNGVYRSLDTGRTWAKLDGGLPATPGRMAIAVTPAAPDRLYVLVSQTNGQLEGLFYSTNTGDTFSQMGFLPTNVLGYQGWYNITVAVSPTTVNDLTVGGVRLYRSTSAGSSWTDIDVHVDQHALHYLTSDSVIIANDGGMYIARNFQGVERNSGLTTTQFYDIGVPASGRIFGGTQDNGSHMWIGGTWSRTQLGGDVLRAIAHPGIGGMLFASGPYGLVYKSTTDGETWFASTNGIDYSRPTVWKAPLLVSPVPGQGSTLFTATTRVYRSSDLATTWQEISGDLATELYSITAIAQARTDANLIVAAAQNGKVFYTRTGGSTPWNDISSGLPERFPTTVAVHPTDKRTFVVAYSGYGTGHIWRTINQGVNWQNVSGNLPDLPVNCFLFDPTLPDTKWYVGTDFGVYYTLNAGQTWLPLTLGLGIAPVTDLEIVQSSGDIFAATFGMGIFRTKIDLLPVELANFEARQQGSDVLLTWETASERNNAFFLVQRSADGERFETVDRVEGYGNSSVLRRYALVDQGAAGIADRLFYRLVQVDADGTESVLPAVEVSMSSAVFLEVQPVTAPNPFSGSTTVQYRIRRTSSVTMALYSMPGVRVRRFFEGAHHNSGRFSVVWDGRDDSGADMPTGLYLLRLDVNGVSTTIPVIKQ